MGDRWARDAGRVDRERLLRDARVIAGWTRESGTEGERRAFDYIQERLRELGVSTRRYEHDSYVSLPVEASLEIDGARVACITHSFSPSTPPTGVTGTAACGCDWSPGDAPLPDLRGRIAVMSGLASPEKVQAAEESGAVGAVFLSGDPFPHEMTVSRVWGSPSAADMVRFPRIPVVSVAGSEAARVGALLHCGKDVRGVNGMHGTGRDRGVGPVFRMATTVDTGWRRLPLLIAEIPGEVEPHHVLVAGHVDSWHHGAMDNATANAAMIEIARLMAGERLYRGLRLAFWSGHSQGRFAGSAWYADRFWHDLDARCVAYVYVDSLGGRGADLLTRGTCMPETRDLIAKVVKDLTGQVFEGRPVNRSGDQSFVGIGIPSVLETLSEHPAAGSEACSDARAMSGGLSGGSGWWWHSTEDTIDKIDPARLLRDTQIYLGCISELCRSSLLPFSYSAAVERILSILDDRRHEIDAAMSGLTVPRPADAGCNGRGQAGLGSMLEPCVDEANALLDEVRQLESLRAAVADCSAGRQEQAGTGESADLGLRPELTLEINETFMDLGRILVPLLHTRSGRFAHDPALPQRLLPCVDEAIAHQSARAAVDEEHDAAKLLTVSLQRGVNQVLDALRRARRRLAPLLRAQRSGLSRDPGHDESGGEISR